MKRIFGLPFCCLLLLFAVTAQSAEQTRHPAADENEQLTCLFLGHSFFAPVVRQIPHQAEKAGLKPPKQMVVFHGGEQGAPGKLWRSEQPDVQKARAWIATGEVQVLALTFYPQDSTFEDYQKWVELALKHNPDTVFLIQAPWSTKQDFTFEQFILRTRMAQAMVHGVITRLQSHYPNTRFGCIPQGEWMISLWALHAAGKLPELTELVARDRRKSEKALFADNFGHGGMLAVREGALLWLAAVYQLDLRKLALDSPVEADLKGLAQGLLEADPHGRP